MGVTIQGNKFYFNGERKDFVLGRSSFKLANIITYHYTGQGGGKYNLDLARKWIEHNQRIFGQDVVLRVFLETGGWDPQSTKMFGSEPSDQGFWNRTALRDGHRETSMHYVGRKVLEWFFKESERTGVAFELVIDATLKHDNIPKGEIDHVIRQVGIEMGRLTDLYPKALIIPNVRNEWNAHNKSGHSLNDVNMWAFRWERDEYWHNAPLLVDPGGSDTFTYKVGGDGYSAAMIHPDRDKGWETAPQRLEKPLRAASFGRPIGFTESMYLVEKEDLERAREWYRPAGWTTDFTKYKIFLKLAEHYIDYLVIHDEKGVQCDPDWPRPLTQLEKYFTKDTPPTPEPDPTVLPGPDVPPQSDELEAKIDGLATRVMLQMNRLEAKIDALSAHLGVK